VWSCPAPEDRSSENSDGSCKIYFPDINTQFHEVLHQKRSGLVREMQSEDWHIFFIHARPLSCKGMVKSAKYCYITNRDMLPFKPREKVFEIYVINKSLPEMGAGSHRIQIPAPHLQSAQSCEHDPLSERLLCCHEHYVEENETFQLPASFLFAIRKMEGLARLLEYSPNSHFSALALEIKPGKPLHGGVKLNVSLPLLQLGLGEY